jgi:hypothetical protein
MGGLGDLDAPPDSIVQDWRDCDRARVMRSGDVDILTHWMGFNRGPIKLFDAALHGAAQDKLQIFRLSEEMIRKERGHGIAIVDRSTNTEGRVLALSHHSEGRLGTQLASLPVLTTGSGVDDLTVDSNWTGDRTTAPIYLIEIDAEGTPDTFKWSNDNGETFTTGVNVETSFITIGDARIKWATTDTHTLGDVWTFTAGNRSHLAKTINRRGAHNYPAIAAIDAKTMMVMPWDVPFVDDGDEIRRALMSGPKIRPRVLTEFSGSDATDVGDTDNAVTSWADRTGGQVTVASANTAPTPASGATDYVRLTIDKSQFKGRIALASTDASGTLKASVKRLRVWLYSDLSEGSIQGRTFSIRFAAATSLGGATKDFLIRGALRGGQWEQFDVNIEVDTDFAYLSVGIFQNLTIPEGRFGGGTTDKLVLNIDLIETDQTTTTSEGSVDVTDLFDGAGEWYFRFSFFNRALNLESPLSPYSLPLKLNAAGLNVDLSGTFPGITTGLANAAPDGADAVRVYVSNSVWANDPRLGRGLSFFRLGPAEGYALADLTALVLPIADEAKDSLVNATDNPRSPFYLGQVPSGDIAVADGNVMVVAGMEQSAVGEWTFTNGSHKIIPVNSGDPKTTPIVEEWMEGRQFQRLGDDEVYTAIKALDTSADGVLDTLYIGKDFDPRLQEYVTPYQGAAGNGEGIIRSDHRSIIWTNHTAERGPDMESTSPLDRLRVMPAGDRIVGMMKVDEFLWVFGTDNLMILRQNAGALSDLPLASGSKYSSPIHIKGIGLAGKRLAITRNDGSGYFISQKGELWLATQAGPQKHPLAAKIAAFLNGKGLLSDTKSIRHSFGDVKIDGQEEHLYLGIVSGVDALTTTPGVVAESDDAYDAQNVGVSDNIEITAEGFWDWTGFTTGTVAGKTPTNIRPGLDYPLGFTDNRDPIVANLWPFDSAQVEDDAYRTKADAVGNVPGLVNYEWVDLTGGDVTATRVATGPQCPPETYVTGLFDPNYVDEQTASNDTGVGWVEDFSGPELTIALPHGGWGLHCHLLQISSAASTGALLRWDYQTQPSAGPNFTLDTCWGPSEQTPQLLFRMFYDGPAGKVIPASTFTVRFSEDDNDDGVSYTDTDVDITQKLYSGQWNLVKIAAPAASAVLQRIHRFEIHLKTAMAADLFDADAEVKLRIANGRVSPNVTTQVSASESPDHPFSYTNADCVDPSVSIETDALDKDFELGLLVDLIASRFFSGKECRFTCTGISPTSACTTAGQQEGQMFLGSRDAFVNLAFDRNLLTWGCPQNRFVWDVATNDPGDATTIRVDTSFEGTFGLLNLPTDVDGNGILENLIIAKLSVDGTLEYRRISVSTLDLITVSAAWTQNPLGTDQVMVGPASGMLEFPERRTIYPSSFHSLKLNLYREFSSNRADDAHVDIEPWYRVSVLKAAGVENQLDQFALTVDKSKIFRAIDLQRGNGLVRIPKTYAKGRRLRFELLHGMTGKNFLSEMTAFEKLRGGEVGR